MSTRSSARQNKSLNESSSTKKPAKAASRQKVFFFDQTLINECESLHLEFFHHPGQNKPVLFVIDKGQKTLYEVKQFDEQNRSWLIDSNICSNGKVYYTIPMDCTFLALHYLKKFCSDKAISLDDIIDPDDSSVHTFMTEFVAKDRLEVVADVKTAAGMKFYKYNPKKTLTWLGVKTKNLAERFKKENIYCGTISISQNYKKSALEEAEDDADYLRSACDIVGTYVDLDTHEKLIDYLGLTETDIKTESSKRKSSGGDNSLSKKIKLENSFSDFVDEPKLPVKEKKITAKEKALAKGAKGKLHSEDTIADQTNDERGYLAQLESNQSASTSPSRIERSKQDDNDLDLLEEFTKARERLKKGKGPNKKFASEIVTVLDNIRDEDIVKRARARMRLILADSMAESARRDLAECEHSRTSSSISEASPF